MPAGRHRTFQTARRCKESLPSFTSLSTCVSTTPLEPLMPTRIVVPVPGDGSPAVPCNALERERLVQTRGGIGVKTGLEDRRDVLVYGHLALCVRDGLRRGVDLVPTLGRLRHARCTEHACTCEHGRGERAYARPKPLRHTASFFHKTPHRMRGTKYRQTGAYSSKGRSAHRSRFGERRA